MNKNYTYSPSLPHYVASFLMNVKDYIDKVTDSNTYIQYARYSISFLSIAMEMLLKEIAMRNRAKIKKQDIDKSFDNQLKSIPMKLKDFLKQVEKRTISTAVLLKVFISATDPPSFGLTDLTNENIEVLAEFYKKVRNPFIHEGRLSPIDHDRVNKALEVTTRIFEMYFGSNYVTFNYTEQIEQILNSGTFPFIKRVLYKALEELQSDEAWRLYCYSKFVICYFLNEAHKIYQAGQDNFATNIMTYYHELANFEQEEGWTASSPLQQDFKSINLPEIYMPLLKIQQDIKRLPINTKILNWSELPLINDTIEACLLTDLGYKKDQLTPEELVRIMIVNTSYGNKKKIISEPEEEEDLLKIVSTFRNAIPPEIAKDLFDLSLLLIRKFLDKFITYK